MSEPVTTYPNLRSEHLEILPNLSNKIDYQEIPTMLPVLSSDEKANFLNIILKCFVPDVSIEETKFHISFLEIEEAAEAIKAISPQFSWVKKNQYTLLALMNFIPDLCSSQTTTTRATVSELKDLLNAVVNHDSHKDILDIMKRANPTQETHWSSFNYFVNLSKVISKTLFLSIAKMHSGVILNYQT